MNLDVVLARREQHGRDLQRHRRGERSARRSGGRAWGKIGQTDLDFEVEGAGQFGSVGKRATSPRGCSPPCSATTAPVRWSPRVYLEFDYASGDKSPGGSVGTFNQLYPNAHPFLGYIDYIGRQNILSASGGLTMTRSAT